MKTESMQFGRWAATVLLCSLILPGTVRAQGSCPCSWYDAVPPNPEWGLPPTLGEMFPFQMYDTEEVEALFLVPLKGLQTLLPPQVQALAIDAEMSPWPYLGPWFPGFGVLVVVFQENNSNQYGGPENQAFTAVMVDDPSWSEGVGAWYAVHWVTTSEAWQWVGSAAWGFSEVIGDSHFQSVKPKGIKAFASAADELIFCMETTTEGMTPAPFPAVINLHTKEGYLVRATGIPTAGTRTASWTIGQSALKLGQHPIAQQLRAIGVGAYPSIGQTWTKHMQTTMERGTCEPLPGPSSN